MKVENSEAFDYPQLLYVEIRKNIMTTLKSKLTTADELLDMPNDGFRYELIQGQLKKAPLAGHEHGRVTVNLSCSLGNFVASKGLGAGYAAGTGFILERNPDTVLAPDAAFVQKTRFAKQRDENFFPAARRILPLPELCLAEILI